MPATSAPFDRDGNMQSYPQPSRAPGGVLEYPWQTEMREVPPFEATMEVIGMETGRSAKRIIWRDTATGKTYPMFVADAVKFLQQKPITATWSPQKRGANYGIKASHVDA